MPRALDVTARIIASRAAVLPPASRSVSCGPRRPPALAPRRASPDATSCAALVTPRAVRCCPNHPVTRGLVIRSSLGSSGPRECAAVNVRPPCYCQIMEACEETTKRGGWRLNAGRKKTGRCRDAPHRTRAQLSPAHPVHVVLRTRRATLRCGAIYRALRRVRARYLGRRDFRVVHISIPARPPAPARRSVRRARAHARHAELRDQRGARDQRERRRLR